MIVLRVQVVIHQYSKTATSFNFHILLILFLQSDVRTQVNMFFTDSLFVHVVFQDTVSYLELILVHSAGWFKVGSNSFASYFYTLI